jgi:hypothetical protein
MSRKQIDLDRLKQGLARIELVPDIIRVPDTIGRTELEQAYHLSAAVLISFDPLQLKAFGQPSNEDRSAIGSLLTNCTLRYDEQGRPRWMLNHGTRKQALARLQTRERLLDALALTKKRPGDRLQTLFEEYVHGSAELVAKQSLTDLRHTMQILDWLSETDLAVDLPSSVEVQTRIAWEELMQPFRYLVADGFCGRKTELEQMVDYLAGNGDRPPLLMYGPGGVGKSTLLAEFILRQTDRRPADDRVPFVYIDFDQAYIDPLEPLTLLITAVRQLFVQDPTLTNMGLEFIEGWTYRLSADTVRGDQNIVVEQTANTVSGSMIGEMGGDFGRGITNRRSARTYRSVLRYINDFLRLVSHHPQAHHPWLFVLDTFEEVQLRSRDAVSLINEFLVTLCKTIPQVRVFIAGRGQVFDISITPLELASFDEAAALAYLKAQKIATANVARAIFRSVGGNPLSLKLAARVILQEGLLENAADPAALRDLLRKVSEGNIQGQLYRRILEHIDDPNVRRLAHPGLTLRRITPELIAKVLAKPCQVTIHDSADAQRLFDLLSREVSLVTLVGSNEVRHRPDVRAVMITALHNDKPIVVHDIHKAAIAYYGQLDGAEARAEEIYHRLFVEHDFTVVDTRWEPRWHDALDRALRPALYEFSPRARAWLAGRLKLTGVDDVDWDETDLPEWEKHTEVRVRDLIRLNDWQGALRLLVQRQERSVGSRLFFLETTILRQQKRWEEARRCAYDGIYSLKQAGDTIQLLDLLRQAIVIDMQLGHMEQAQSELAHARELLMAQPGTNELVALELDVFALVIESQRGDHKAKAIAPLRHAILQRFLNLSDQELLTHPQLIRDVLTEFAGENNEVLRRGLNLLMLGDPTPEQRAQLANVMQLWDLALSRTLEQPPGVLLREVDKSKTLGFEKGWQTYMQATSARVLGRDIDKLLAQYGHLKANISPDNSAVIMGDSSTVTGTVIGDIIAGDISGNVNPKVGVVEPAGGSSIGVRIEGLVSGDQAEDNIDERSGDEGAVTGAG